MLDNSSEVARFAYDGLGRRAQKTAAGVTRTYVYGGDDVIEERLNSGGVVRYIHGPDIDQPLASVDAGGTVSYFLADHLGSIVQTTSSSAVVTLTRQYDAYGNLSVGIGTAGNAFTGREWDPEIELYYYRARYYDPQTGKFISEDPIGVGDGPNVYQYAYNAPIRYTDPTGLMVRPDPNLPPSVRCRIQGALSRIRRTRRGREYIDPLMRSDRDIVITTYSDPGWGGSHWNPATDRVHVDLRELHFPERGYNSETGPAATSLEQLLAHELGHSTQPPPRDPVSYEREATRQFENPVITELGQPPRTDPMIPYEGVK
jgi:RHS repeat-associated protein